MVKGEDSQLSGYGFESRRHILDGVRKLDITLEKEIEVAKWGTPKKNIKNYSTLILSILTYPYFLGIINPNITLYY